MNDKGQLTMFVIIGLAVLLIIALTVLFIRPPEVEQAGRAEVQQLTTFIEACVQLEAEDVLQTIGYQGGLYDLTGRQFNEEQPWRGDAFKDGPQTVAYWYLMEDCEQQPGCLRFLPPPMCEPGQCIFDGQYPGAGPSIQAEFERALEERLQRCVQDFAQVEAFSLVSNEDPEVAASFTSDDVRVSVDWPMRFRNVATDQTVLLDEFGVTLNVDFEETYRLARQILELEYKTQFVEENFLHLLSVYQGDPPLLPPFTDASFFGSQKIWVRAEAEDRLEQEVLPYLSFMQVPNAYAGYHPFIVPEGTDPLYHDYVRGLFAYGDIFLDGAQYPDHGVGFLYPFSNIYLNINDEEVLKGQSLDNGNFFMKMAGLLIRHYEHKYDVSWPLLVTVTDTEAFDGDGYSLTFGIEANIVNNLPMTPGRTVITIDQRGNPRLDQGEPQHHAEGTVRVRATDRHTGDPLEGAQIVYECGWSYTDATGTDRDGDWTGTLPYCEYGGILRLEQPGTHYPDARVFNNRGDGGDLSLTLWPLVEKEVVLYKIPADKLNTCTNAVACREPLSWDEAFAYEYFVDSDGFWQETCDDCATQSVDATQDQYAMVMINRVPTATVFDPLPLRNTLTFGKSGELVSFNQGAELEDYLDQFDLSPEDEAELRELQAVQFETSLNDEYVVELVPGAYTIEGMLFFNDELHIPSEKRGGGLFQPSVTLPAIDLPTWLQGGIVLNDPAVSFTEEEIYNENRLVIYVIEQPLPTNWGMLENHEPIEEFQKQYLTIAQPVFE